MLRDTFCWRIFTNPGLLLLLKASYRFCCARAQLAETFLSIWSWKWSCLFVFFFVFLHFSRCIHSILILISMPWSSRPSLPGTSSIGPIIHSAVCTASRLSQNPLFCANSLRVETASRFTTGFWHWIPHNILCCANLSQICSEVSSWPAFPFLLLPKYTPTKPFDSLELFDLR